jgi:hypothetical protein
MIRHVVLLRFKDDTPADTQAAIEQAFAGLSREIPHIRNLEWGVNSSAEGLDKGFTHCFLISFENEVERDAYLPHPAHTRLVAVMQPWLADVLVVDYALGATT